MAPRSRTGCLTCRQRKLKCSEERPVCAQCAKANRECIPSSGITFRHQQNPSMNGQDLGEGSLKSFYGYKETFGNSTIWVDIPQQLTFVHTNNPYEDLRDDGGPSNSAAGHATTFHDGSDGIDSALASGLASLAENANRFEENQHGNGEYSFPPYPPGQYATHGLEALSAVASQDQYNYAPPPATMVDNPEGSPSAAQMTAAQDSLEQMLKQASSADSNIDPALHTDTSGAESGGHQLVAAEEPTAS